MAKVTDEMLMAYADGALNALARAKIEAFLEKDPEARRRVEIFRATGAPLSRLYRQPMAEPVPAHLRDFVLNYRPAEEAPKARLSTAWFHQSFASLAEKGRLLGGSLVAWLDKPAPQAMRWQFAAASAAIVALGVGAGVLFHDDGGTPSNDLVAFEDGHIFAGGALRRVLEKSPSGQEIRIGGVRGEAISVRANLTFKSKQHTYCREYEIATPGNGGFVGLGCRGDDGKWALEVHVPAEAAAKGAVKSASGPGKVALDEIVDRMMDGDAFGRDEEAAAIDHGWK